VAGERILPQHALHQHRQPINAFAVMRSTA
jgi:hypothetical protein